MIAPAEVLINLSLVFFSNQKSTLHNLVAFMFETTSTMHNSQQNFEQLFQTYMFFTTPKQGPTQRSKGPVKRSESPARRAEAHEGGGGAKSSWAERR